MIDWLTVKIEHRHNPINAGRVIAIQPDGSIEWETLKAATVKGSFESKIQVRSTGDIDEQGRASILMVSGNPSKFMQGHNVFGSECVTSLLVETLNRIDSILGIGTVSRLSVASAVVSRIDFTKSLEFPALCEAQAYIRQVGLRARTRNGRPMIKGHTLTFQKSSRRWSVVVYSKGDEIKAHPLPENLPLKTQVQNEAQKLVRVELRLRGLELEKLQMRTIQNCTPENLNAAYRKYIGKIEMESNTKVVTDVILSMTPAYRSTYLLWKEGIDLAATMKRATFFRHRKVLKSYGVDISVAFDQEATAEIIPIHRIITGKPHSIPDWAIEGGLLFAA